MSENKPKRSNLIDGREFYLRAMHTPKSKPKRIDWKSGLNAFASLCFLGAIIAILATAPKIELPSSPAPEAPTVEDNSTVMPPKRSEGEMDKAAAAITKGILQRIVDCPNDHVLVATLPDGSLMRAAMPAYATLMKETGQDAALIEREIRAMVRNALEVGAVNFELVDIVKDPSKKA